jgi:16S rRNA (guanine527-N7)-methyltransferase
MDILQTYFPALTEQQKAQFAQLPALYEEWNSQINVISRADVANLMERHVLHSLAIAKFIQFKPGTQILDLGTGGGFPGIPLAILFPEVQFTLADSIGKKIKVVNEVAQALDLKNVIALQSRVEELKMPKKFDFVVTRAVATADKLLFWAHKLISTTQKNAYPNGLIALKGGKLGSELKLLPGKAKEYTEVVSLADYFQEEFFNEKCILYVQG